MALDLEQHAHRRLNLMTGEWVQVSPGRINRPWQGREEEQPEEKRPEYDPDCYLCPGNTRTGGVRNPDYDSTFVFTNDFSSLEPETPDKSVNRNDLLIAAGERGMCRVICFSPRHDLTLPEMRREKIREVVDLWVGQYRELGDQPEINHVQIFENKGKMMGCSNPHPHGQVYAQKTIPEEPSKELNRCRQYYDEHDQTLLSDYLDLELKLEERVVDANDHFVILVPFWAYWPFETLIVSRRPFSRFTDMDDCEKDALAGIIRTMTIKFDNLFNISFPYSAGFHAAPTDGNEHPYCHFHMHFYPPLLRSATIKKFQAGYEMLGNLQRDFTPEYAADQLRDSSLRHYKERQV